MKSVGSVLECKQVKGKHDRQIAVLSQEGKLFPKNNDNERIMKQAEKSNITNEPRNNSMHFIRHFLFKFSALSQIALKTGE